jgi:hypothetical protein
MWDTQLSALSEAELKGVLRWTLTNGSPHPPTLPEVLAVARNNRPKPELTTERSAGQVLSERLVETFGRVMSPWQLASRWTFMARTSEVVDDQGKTRKAVELVGIVVQADPTDPDRYPSRQILEAA